MEQVLNQWRGIDMETIQDKDIGRNLLLEVWDKLDSLTDNLLEFIISVPVIEKRTTPAAVFWMPSPEKKNGLEN